MSTTETRKGVRAFGWVNNIRTFVQECNALLSNEDVPLTAFEFNSMIEDAISQKSIDYRNRLGKKVSEEYALFALFATNRKNKKGEYLFAYYERPRVEKNWSGINYTTQEGFKKIVQEKSMFRMGELSFENWQDGLQFLEELKGKSIPEKWTYKSYKSTMPYPILKAYIENTFEKLKKEDNGAKILKSDDGKYIVFNSGLLDRFFHEIFIIVHVVDNDGEAAYRNPYLMNSLSDLTRVGFISNGKKIVKLDDLPEPALFFSNINEVIFHPSIEIDRNYDRFTHIIDDRRERFPLSDQEKDTTELARNLDNSINYAIAIAKRNYKLVVPMYRPQENKIQLLMPIYLSGSFTSNPNFALVLNLEHEVYTPETILPLDAAYQNARLITKPDELWLNPDDI